MMTPRKPKEPPKVYECASHKGPSSEVKLISVTARVDGQIVIGLTLICHNCLRAGAKIDATAMWPDAKEIEFVSAAGY